MNEARSEQISLVFYVVHEQWPHRDVACFFSAHDARRFARSARLNLPIILKHHAPLEPCPACGRTALLSQEPRQGMTATMPICRTCWQSADRILAQLELETK